MGFRIFSQLFERSWARAGFSIVLALGAVSGITLMQYGNLGRDGSAGLSPVAQEQQERLAIQSLKYLPTQGFGFNNLIADWTFLRFLQYAGDFEAREKTGYRVAANHFDVMTQRDPRFLESYQFAAGTLSYDLGQPEDAMLILDRGLAAFDPKLHAGAHTLWVFKGLDQLLLLNDAPAAAQSYAMGAKWAAQSPDPEMRKDAPVLERRSQFLTRNPDSVGVRFWAWNIVYGQAQATKSRSTMVRARTELLKMGARETQNAEGMTVFLPPAPKPTPKPTPEPEVSADSAAPQKSPDASDEMGKSDQSPPPNSAPDVKASPPVASPTPTNAPTPTPSETP